MISVELKGIDSIIAKLEYRTVQYQEAVDDAIEFARDTILKRVEMGQLVDGTYRTTQSKDRIDRYSESWGLQRRKEGKSTRVHNLKMDGSLYNNFVVGRKMVINKRNVRFNRTLLFTNKLIPNKTITYAELAQIQESKTGVGFALSPTQYSKMMSRLKARLN